MARWKAVAKEIGASGANRGKVVISLFDYSGKWAQPWRDAGYSVIQHDIKTGSDLLTDAWIYDQIEEARREGVEVYGVLAALPCTTFAGSGARWWAGRHDVESPEALAQVFGEKAISSGAKSAREYNVMLYQATRDMIALANPTGFHALENPTGRIERATGLPEPTIRFDPSNFGDPYTKKTGIYGSFRADLPTANVDPVEGSKVQSKLRGYNALDKEARSDTPDGFAYAFFMANDPQARERMAEPPAPKAPERRPSPRPVPPLDGMSPMGMATKPEGKKAEPSVADSRIAARNAMLPKGYRLAYDSGGRNLHLFGPDGGIVSALAAAFATMPPSQQTIVLKKAQNIAVNHANRGADGHARPAPTTLKVGPVERAPKAEIDAAAAKADPSPTEAQAEAGNYQMGHVTVHGLDVTIETAKGNARPGRDNPIAAHYGYIKRTEGADGDHIDAYVGDHPERDAVYIFDQYDPKTGKFDEHKVVLGARNADDARRIYDAGFSDGSGPKRRRGPLGLDVDEFKVWLAGKGPSKPATQATSDDVRPKAAPPVANDRVEAKIRDARVAGWKAARDGLPREVPAFLGDGDLADAWNAGYSTGSYGAENKLVSRDRAAELRERLKAKLRDQLNSGIDPEILAIGAELAVFHIEAGARRFGAFAKAIADDLGTTPDKLRPYLRSWYNGARDMIEDHGISIEGMDSPEDVRAALAEIGKAPLNETPSTSPDPVVQSQETGGDGDDDRGNAASDDQPLAQDGADGDREMELGGSADAEPGLREPDPEGDGRAETGGAERGRSLDGGAKPVLSGKAAKPRPVGQGPVHRVEDRPDALTGENPGNFVITEADGVGTGTDGEKIKANVAAIRLLKDLQATGRFPTREEQAVLARYVGWGGLKSVFDPKKAGATDMYGRAQADLKSLLTPDEYAAANASIRNAHYTAPGVVSAMWRAARHFGFTGGRALEPTVGTGNFLGLQPADMAAGTEWHAAELDNITGGIAQMLYPEANVIAGKGFETAAFADDAFDPAIGNPPFGAQTIKDRSKQRKHLGGLKIHNYIIAKSGMHLRPGGVMAMVVTHRFLDTANPEARDVLAKDFRFLGAIRLPNDAFVANAGTEVTTDIVFLQKLGPDEARERDAAWLDTEGELSIEGGGTARVNRYFVENPGHILGRSAMDGTMYAGRRNEKGLGEYTVHGDGRDLGAAIDGILSGDWAKYRGILKGDTARASSPAMIVESDLPVGGMMLSPEGKVTRRDLDDDAGNAVIEEVTAESLWKNLAEEWLAAAQAARAYFVAASTGDGDPHAARAALLDASGVAYTAAGGKKPKRTKAEQAVYDLIEAAHDKDVRALGGAVDEIEKASNNRRLGVKGLRALKGMLDLRNRTLRLIQAEKFNHPDMEADRADLNAAYDAFVDEHGPIGENVDILAGDYGVEVGLEADYKPKVTREAAKKQGIEPSPAQATKADILSRRVNFPHREITRAKDAVDGLNVSLSERGRVDLDYIARLTGSTPGDVAAELMRGPKPHAFLDPETGQYVHSDAYLSGNVKAKLEAAREAGMEGNASALQAALPEPLPQEKITPSLRGGAWIPAEIFEAFLTDLGATGAKVSVVPSLGRLAIVNSGSGAPTALGAEFEDDHATVGEIFGAAAAGKAMTVRVRDGKDTVVDPEATKDLNAKVERMAKVFAEWAFADESRARAIVADFNEKMNTHRKRAYDGVSFLKAPGASDAVKLRRTQKNAAWR